jgi:hypothetical protein
VHAARGAVGAGHAHRLDEQRDGARGHERGAQVVAPERAVHRGQVGEVRERRGVAARVVDDAPQLPGERAPADGVGRRGEPQPHGEQRAPRARREAARLGGDHVQPRPRMGEDLVDARVAEQQVEAAPEHARHLGASGRAE